MNINIPISIYKLYHETFSKIYDKDKEACASFLDIESKLSLSWLQLDNRIFELISALQTIDLPSEKIVAICFDGHLEALISIIALSYLGIQFWCLNENSGLKIIKERIIHYEVSTVLSYPTINSNLSKAMKDLSTKGWSHNKSISNNIIYWHYNSYKKETGENCMRKNTCEKNNDKSIFSITTSGTTGLAKMIEVPLSCIWPNVVHFYEMFDICNVDTIAMTSPLTFDPSMIDILLWLQSGCRLIMTSARLRLNSLEYSKLIITSSTTVIQITPTLLYNIGEHLMRRNNSLRILSIGGEVFPIHFVQKIFNNSDAINNGINERLRIFNVYGITEVSCWSFIYELNENDLIDTSISEIPLGELILHTEAMVYQIPKVAIGINQSPNICNISEASFDGLLLIGGKQRKCHINDTLYKKKEFPDGFISSGDIVKLASDHQWYFKQRNDGQIKWNGKRINPEHIKLELQSIGVVSTLIFQDNQLLLFVLAHKDHRQICMNHLRLTLEDYEFPSDCYTLNKFPITPNGKIDKKALHDIHRVLISSHVPVSDIMDSEEHRLEVYLISKYGECLGITAANKSEQTFIELGGDSHKATDLWNILGLEPIHLINMIMNTKMNEFIDFIIENKTLLFANFLVTEKCITGTRENEISEINSKEVISIEYDIMDDEIKENQKSETKLMQEILSLPDILQSTNIYYRGNNGCNIILDDIGEQRSDSSIENDVCKRSKYSYEEMKIKWKFDTGKCVDSSPLIVLFKYELSLIFIGSHSHNFYALNANTGNCIWSIELPDRIESSACLSGCNKYVIIGCYGGSLNIINVLTGELFLRLQTEGDIKCTPICYNSNVYYGSHDGCIYRYNFDDKELEIVWITNVKSPIFATPICNDLLTYVASVNKSLYLINWNGEKVKEFTTEGCIFSSPILVTQRSKTTVVFGCHDNYIYCLSSIDLMLIWKRGFGASLYSTPYAFRQHDTYLIAMADIRGNIRTIHATDGSIDRELRMPSNGEVFSSPVVSICCNVSTLYIGCRDNHVYCITL